MKSKIKSITYNEQKKDVVVVFQNGCKAGAIGKLSSKIYKNATKLTKK